MPGFWESELFHAQSIQRRSFIQRSFIHNFSHLLKPKGGSNLQIFGKFFRRFYRATKCTYYTSVTELLCLQTCEAAAKTKGHYKCQPDGHIQCLPGWTGDVCDVPICKAGCDPLLGYCKHPNECICKIGELEVLKGRIFI